MGTVYKVHDRVLNETAALKVLRADLARSPETGRRFRREIKLARRVRHKNVCAIHQYGDEGGLRYISMEFVDGENLRQRVVKGAVPVAEALGIAAQIADGLEAIHEIGVVHRDLKTANIVLDGRGLVRLMDFGIAKELHADTTETSTGTILGTPEYMSPEQASGGKIDFRSDIYALGVVIFELLTGAVPFRADTPLATMMLHVREPPPLDEARAAGIPPAVRELIARALAKKPAERFATAGEMGEALKRLQSELEQCPAPQRSAVTPPAPIALTGTTARAPGARRPSDPGRVVVTPSPRTRRVTRLPPATRATRPRRLVGWLAAAMVLALLGGLAGFGLLPGPPIEPIEPQTVAEPALASPPSGAGQQARDVATSVLASRPVEFQGSASPAPASGRVQPERPTSPTTGLPERVVVEAAPPTTLPIAEQSPPPAVPAFGGPRPAGPGQGPAREAAPGAPGSKAPLERAPLPRLELKPLAEPSGQPKAGADPAAGGVAAEPPPPAASPRPSPPAEAGVTSGQAAPKPAERSVEPAAVPSAERPPRPGELRVVVLPWAEVVVDGVPRGTTPLPALTLEPGSHTLQVRHPAYEPLERVVTIHRGELETLRIDLKSEGTRKR
jgi:serine/threonine protein kinase